MSSLHTDTLYAYIIHKLMTNEPKCKSLKMLYIMKKLTEMTLPIQSSDCLSCANAERLLSKENLSLTEEFLPNLCSLMK